MLRSTLLACLGFGVIGALAPAAVAQDDQNLAPAITNATLSRGTVGLVCPGPIMADRADCSAILDEAEALRICVTLVDGDLAMMDSDEELFVTVNMNWVPTFGAPEPGAAQTLQLGPLASNGTNMIPLTNGQLSLVIPPMVGPNQRRLRGDIDFDAQWIVEVTVFDKQGAQDQLEFLICALDNPSIGPFNPPPFADAGADQRVVAGNLVTLDASGTFDATNIGFDPLLPGIVAKDNLSFTWEWISGPAGTTPTSPTANTANPALASVRLETTGRYVFRVTVTDGVNAVPSSDTVNVDVVSLIRDNNQPKAVINGPTATVISGAIITLDGTSSRDPEGDQLSFRWRQTDEVGGRLTEDDLLSGFQPLSGLTSPITTWQATKPGTYYVRLLVSDGALTDSVRVTIVVADTAAAGATVSRTETTDAPGVTADDTTQTPLPSVPACGGSLFGLALVPFWLLGLRRIRR